MDIFRLEEIRIDLHSKLSKEKFPLIQLSLLNNYFRTILNSDNDTITEAYLSEFLTNYCSVLSNLHPQGLNPIQVENELHYCETLLNSNLFLEYTETVKNEIKRIKEAVFLISSALEGKKTDIDHEILSFPVNVQFSDKNVVYGQIETFAVKIHKNNSLLHNKFLIVPSAEKVEKRLEDQINISWQIAINFLKKYYKKPQKYHEVVIIFNHKFANLEGYSLGLAITLGFIKELFTFYNTSLSLSQNTNVTFTGGINSKNNIMSVGNTIIDKKVETVFYSTFNFFAVPDTDFLSAKLKLKELKNKWPKRELKIINIEDFDDLINHRQIVNIERARIPERTKKFVKKNRSTLLLLITLISILGILGIYSIDNNPQEFEIIGSRLNILNSNGKILWSVNIGNQNINRKLKGKYFQRVFDIDKDGKNEVILSHEFLDNKNMGNDGRIACFDHTGYLIWKYKFRDSVSTIKEMYKDQYVSRLVDIVNINGRDILFANARHVYFPSAIYKLDLKTGTRIQGTVWSQGHFRSGEIGDFNEDGNLELFIGGINNGMETAFALILELDKMSGQTPSTEDYLFKALEISDFTKYFLFPKTDICNLNMNRFNGTDLTHFYEDTKTYQIAVDEKYLSRHVGPHYVFNQTLDSAWTQIGDDLQFIRDSLIIKGKLSPPFTTEKLYEKKLINNILEWDGNKFVKFSNNY